MTTRFAAAVSALLLCSCSASAFDPERAEVEQAVRSSMKDPDATKISNLLRCSGDKEVWSGNANGKNSFGAYAGDKPFFYASGSVAFAGDDAFSSFMDRCYSDLPDSGLKEDIKSVEGQLATEPTASKVDAKADTPVTVDQQPGYSDPEEGENLVAEPEAAADECWADYCPCDKGNPDYGYLDVTLCRKLKMGEPVSSSEFSIGAGSRDARKALREWKAENGGNF